MFDRDLDGSIMTFRSNEKKWSYIKTDDEKVVLVKEKEVISDLATTGLYLFKSSLEFLSAAIELIVKNDRYNNEFYVAPVYNYLISRRKKIGYYNIEKSKFFGVGTPEDLMIYLEHLNEKI